MGDCSVRLTILVEDVAGGRGLLAEHGLAFWIEAGGRRVLFDAGQGLALERNAHALGVDLAMLDAVVLSHGHYDHTGGLPHVLGRSPGARVYAHRKALEPSFGGGEASGRARRIGIPPESLKSLNENAQVFFVEEPVEIEGGLRLTGPVPRETDFEDTGGAFYADAPCQQPDLLPDDQAAFFETPEGAVVFLGCAHAGVINTLRHVTRLTGGPIHTAIGGMHLLQADGNRLEATVRELRRLDVQRLYPCHCTGFDATALLRSEFGERCVICRAGSVLDLPA